MNTTHPPHQSNPFQPKHHYLPETTLPQFTNSNLTQSNGTNPRQMHSRSKTSTIDQLVCESSGKGYGEDEMGYQIVELKGRSYEIEYGSVVGFQKSFQKLMRETEISYGLALKVVILARVIKKNGELEQILDKVLEQYGKNKFRKIQHTTFI